MSDGEGIHYSKSATVFVGRDAVEVFRLAALASALRLWAKTKMIPTRGMTITKMLKAAGEVTKQRYRSNPEAAQIAAADLDVFIKVMKSALPTTVEGKTTP